MGIGNGLNLLGDKFLIEVYISIPPADDSSILVSLTNELTAHQVSNQRITSLAKVLAVPELSNGVHNSFRGMSVGDIVYTNESFNASYVTEDYMKWWLSNRESENLAASKLDPAAKKNKESPPPMWAGKYHDWIRKYGFNIDKLTQYSDDNNPEGWDKENVFLVPFAELKCVVDPKWVVNWVLDGCE